MTALMPPPREARLWDLANLYKLSATLFALAEAGVLSRLAAGEQTVADLAASCAVDAAVLEPLVELLAAAGALGRNGERYAIDDAGARMLPLVQLEAQMCATRINHRNLVSLLRGNPLGDPMNDASAAALWPLYRRAMAVSAQALAPHLVRFGKMRPGAHVVDLGGADGTLALAMARMVPGLRLTVVDRAVNADAFAAALKAEVGLAEARFCEGDLQDAEALAPLLSSATIVVASNSIHLLTIAQRRKLFGVIRASLPAGGTLLVYDQFVSRERADSASCLVVDWLLCGFRFDCTEGELGDELSTLGFADVRHKRVANLPGALVAATT